MLRLSPKSAQGSLRQNSGNVAIAKSPRSIVMQSNRHENNVTSSSASIVGLIGMQLYVPSISFAEEVAAQIPSEVAAQVPSGDISSTEIILLTCPLVAYAFFNKIRDTNPQAGIGEYALSLVFTVIMANLVSILAFNTRIY